MIGVFGVHAHDCMKAWEWRTRQAPAAIVGVNHLSRKLWRGNVVSARMVRCLCVLLAATTLNGCGWFDGWFGGKPSPLQSAPLRPGVDRQTTANGLPPAPNRGTYDAGVAPVDDNRSQPLGAIVPAKGGQKAQLEAAEKDKASARPSAKRSVRSGRPSGTARRRRSGLRVPRRRLHHRTRLRLRHPAPAPAARACTFQPAGRALKPASAGGRKALGRTISDPDVFPTKKAAREGRLLRRCQSGLGRGVGAAGPAIAGRRQRDLRADKRVLEHRDALGVVAGFALGDRGCGGVSTWRLRYSRHLSLSALQ